ncbi:MAG: heme-degrading domain-containing protein [Tissierellia bacterium]|nr:heme-degrading domain-containing protein [Tissierellia bacterium]
MKSASEMIELIKHQEESLQFDEFNEEIALKLGLACIEEAKENNIPISVEICMNGSTLFYYRSKGTSDHNSDWLRRKTNAVNKLDMSSLQLFYYLIDAKRELKKDMFLDPMDYAACGGGFPIRIKGVGLVGSISYSALPHLEDHDFVVKVLSKFLNVKLVD